MSRRPVPDQVVQGLARSGVPTLLAVLLDTMSTDLPAADLVHYLNVALTEAVERRDGDMLAVVLQHRPRYRDLTWDLLRCFRLNQLNLAHLIVAAAPGLLDFDVENAEMSQPTVLATLIDENQTEMVRWVLNHGADPRAHYGLAAMVATERQRWDLLEMLVQYGLDPRHMGQAVRRAYMASDRWSSAPEALRMTFTRGASTDPS